MESKKLTVFVAAVAFVSATPTKGAASTRTMTMLRGLSLRGRSGVSPIRGPGLNVIDASLFRRAALGRARAEFRVDAFNVLNRPQFNAPDRSLTSSTFGRVLSAQLSREVQASVRLSF